MDDQGTQPPDSGGEQDMKQEDSSNWLAYGLSFGMVAGVVIGTITDNLALWIGVGLAMGLAIGAGFANAKKERPADPESP